ncbi:MAG: ATP-binding protein [Thermomicrobiales bacterium]
MSRLRRRLASTRTRLTLWYAALLLVVLVAVGVSVDALASNRLQADVDRRLQSTAQDIGLVIQQRLATWPFTTEPVRFTDIVPNLGSFASRGLIVQIADPNGEVVRGSEYAPEEPLIPEDKEPTGDPRIITTTWNGDQMRVVHYPVVVTDRSGARWYIGAVIVGERLNTMYETLRSLRQVLLAASAMGLVLALIAGWAMAGRALRPVDQVTAAAARIAAGDGAAASLSARLPVPPTDDELARLSATFNAMLDRLQATFRAQERFVADASHELRTPLTAIRGNVDVLRRQTRNSTRPMYPEDVAPALDDIRAESDRMRRLLDDLLLMARTDSNAETGLAPLSQTGPIRVDLIAQDAVRSASAMAQGQRVELEAPRPATITGDADRIRQLIMILLDNALRHTPPAGEVRVAVAAGADGAVRIAVRDSGEGISAEHLPHIFERFYRADGARGRSSGGTGLGLAIARAICSAHGGDISAASSPGNGSTFVATLPVSGAETPVRRTAQPAAPARSMAAPR